MKRCSGCGIAKPPEGFYSGRGARCKDCKRAQVAAYRAANADEIRRRHREQYWPRWYAQNREAKIAADRAWRDQTGYGKAYYAANREASIKAAVAWKQQNREQANATERAARQRDPERARARSRKWAQGNPDKVRARVERRRARVANAFSDLTDAQWQDRIAEYGSRCAYCLKYVDRPTMEHMTPLSGGGAHTITNIVPACAQCNGGKGARTLLEFTGR